MFQPSYTRKLDAISSSGRLSNQRKEKKRDLNISRDILDDPFIIRHDEVAEEKPAIDSWKKEQARRQNQVATLLEVEEDDDDEQDIAEAAAFQKAEAERQERINALLKNKTKPLEAKYKGIHINSIKQLDLLKNLVDPQVAKYYLSNQQPIQLIGILLEIDYKKAGLILAEISVDNRISKIISLVVLPQYSNCKIEKRLITCLEKTLPKLNCDRLTFSKDMKRVY